MYQCGLVLWWLPAARGFQTLLKYIPISPHFSILFSPFPLLFHPTHHLLLHLKLFICKLSSFSPFFLYPLFPLHPLPLALLLPVFLFLPLFFGPLFVPLCYALSRSHHTFFSLSHLSIRSWKSVSAIITMQSCSLWERLTARASRRLNSSQNKSCKHSALNWRMRAKPCWVSSLCVCVCVFTLR